MVGGHVKHIGRVLLSAALIIGLLGPSHAAGSSGSLIGGFASTKSSLTAQQKTQLNKLVSLGGTLETIKCTAYVAEKASKSELALASARAKSVCAYLKGRELGLRISTAILKSKNKSLVGKVQVSPLKRATGGQQPSATPTPTVQPDDYAFAQINLNECALSEISNTSGAGSKGFPMRFGLSPTGKVGVAVIPVDFENAIGAGSPAEMFKDDVTQVTAWGEYFSRGKLDYDVLLASDTWLRAPKGADWYTCAECGKGASSQKQSREAAFQELVTLADSKVNFTTIDFVYFVFPHEAESKFGTTIYARSVPVQTQEGTRVLYGYGEMAGAFMSASQMDRTKIWDHLVHEILHFQGFIGHGPLNGSEMNIMTNQWGSAKSVTAWEGFMAGWFGDSEITCLDVTKLDRPALLSMSSIDDFGDKPAAAMIRLSSEEILVVERRTNGTYTSLPNRDFEAASGFTAYRVNVNGESYRDDRDVAGTELRNFWAYLRENGKIKIDSSVNYKTVKIRVVNSTQVEVSRG